MDTTPPVVRAFVRADCQLGAEQSKEELLGTLTSLRDRGRFADVEVVPWGRNFRPHSPFTGTEYHETVARFLDDAESWAAENGRSLDGILRRETVRSEISGEEYDVVTLPVLCVAEVVEGSIERVFPHRRGEEVVSIREYLSSLSDESTRAGPTSPPAESTTEDRTGERHRLATGRTRR